MEVNENLEMNCWKSDYYHMRKTRWMEISSIAPAYTSSVEDYSKELS